MPCGANEASLKVTPPPLHSVTKPLILKSPIVIIVERLYMFSKERVPTAEPVEIPSNALFAMQ